MPFDERSCSVNNQDKTSLTTQPYTLSNPFKFILFYSNILSPPSYFHYIKIVHIDDSNYSHSLSLSDSWYLYLHRECISKVCEAAGLKTADRKRKVVKTISRILGERPVMEHAGSNVNLTITSTALTLSVLESGQVVASHDMPNISFASGGDPVSTVLYCFFFGF